ncbi:MAG: diacylglycerol kinase family protein [Pseudomonadota bacterium]
MTALPKPRLLCLCNARSGAHRNRAQSLRERVGDRPGVRFALTHSVADMAEHVSKFAPTGDDLVAVSGGDGSLQALLTLLARHDATHAPRLAVLPGGSTNMSARDINRHHRWEQTAATLAHLAEAPQEAVPVPRPVMRVHDPAGMQAGFFFGAGAVVEGIDYCNRQLWDQGAARREATAGLAMARTILGVLRGEAPFDQPLAVHITLHHQGSPVPLEIAPNGGATVLAASTLHRLLVGVRPYWGAEPGAVRFSLVERSAPLLRHLPGLLGLPVVPRPSPRRGFHSHNADRLSLHLTAPADGRPATYAVDGEVFAAPTTSFEVDGNWSPKFVPL